MCYLIKKFLMMTKKNIFMIYFLCQIEILLQNMLKMFKIPGISSFFQIPGFLCPNCQIPGFSMFFKVKWQLCGKLQKKNFKPKVDYLKLLLAQTTFTFYLK